jgi:bifunctional UDP-N-acetylglucosamine pyrophosphorylase/glucosamine-1-phosphate N-acetyltransferase
MLNDYNDRHLEFTVCQTFQNQPLGTGDAARQGFLGLQHDNAHLSLAGRTLVVVTGDTPLLTPTTLHRFVSFHRDGGYAVSVLAFHTNIPVGYGRVLLDSKGHFFAIREEKDCTDEEREVKLCHSGIMCIEATEAERLLGSLNRNNAAQEYYLTDVPAIAKEICSDRTEPVGVFRAREGQEFEGVNTQEQLARAASVLQQRVLAVHMAHGVRFEAPHLCYVEPEVTFGEGVVVEPFVCLRGQVHIPAGTRVKSGTGIVACPQFAE